MSSSRQFCIIIHNNSDGEKDESLVLSFLGHNYLPPNEQPSATGSVLHLMHYLRLCELLVKSMPDKMCQNLLIGFIQKIPHNWCRIDHDKRLLLVSCVT